MRGEYQLFKNSLILALDIKIQVSSLAWRMKVRSLYLEQFKLVDDPQEYYTIISLTDTIEFIYRIHKRK